MLEGRVMSIGADTSANGDLQAEPAKGDSSKRAYRVRVHLSTQELANGDEKLRLSPGMTLSAELVQGRWRLIQYLLSPVSRLASEAARQR